MSGYEDPIVRYSRHRRVAVRGSNKHHLRTRRDVGQPHNRGVRLGYVANLNPLNVWSGIGETLKSDRQQQKIRYCEDPTPHCQYTNRIDVRSLWEYSSKIK